MPMNALKFADVCLAPGKLGDALMRALRSRAPAPPKT
jgi:hypothetical protein